MKPPLFDVVRDYSGTPQKTRLISEKSPFPGLFLLEYQPLILAEGYFASSVSHGARPVDGITLNEALEYLLDDTGKTRIFQNQPEAEAFLLCHGFTSEDLEHFYFVEVPENEE